MTKPDDASGREPRNRDDRGNETPADAETQSKAKRKESFDAAATHEVVRREAVKELDRSPAALAWSGLAAGLAMGFSFVAEGTLRSHLPDAEWRPLIAKLVLATTTMFDEKLKSAFHDIGLEAVEPSAGTIFIRAIFAGMLIALLVWMLPAAKTAHVWVIVIMTWLVGAAGLAHVIVGSVETSYLIWSGAASVGTYVFHFMLPTLLGNTLGGVGLVAIVNHMQVTSGES